MIYKHPTQDGNGYYVPIVAKNKDYLTGVIISSQDYTDILLDLIDATKTSMSVDGLTPFLDSTRYNDILMSGRRESDMSSIERKEYFHNMIDNIYEDIHSHPADDVSFKSTSVLSVDCQCGFGCYSWDTIKSIPDETFCCVECGKILIHYTNENCEEYKYDEGNVL